MATITRDIIEKQVTVKIFEIKKHLFKKSEIEKIKDISLTIDAIPNIKDEFLIIHGKYWNLNKINKVKDEQGILYKVINKKLIFNELMNEYYIDLYVKKVK